MPIIKKCKICNNKFKVKPSHLNIIHYCSRDCRIRGITTKVEFNCFHCNKKFMKKPCDISKKNFCSKKCYSDSGITWNKGMKFPEFSGNGHPRYKEPMSVICKMCKGEFHVKPCFAKKRIFCSMRCSTIFKNKFIFPGLPRKKNGINQREIFNKNCLKCGKLISGCQSYIKSKVFCSRFCKNSHNRTGKLADKSANWKGGKHIHNGYVLVYTPNHPHKVMRFYVREHRLVMEKHIGRYLEPKEVVHHINGNKADNRIENLKLFVKNSDHLNYHKSLRRNP